MKCPKCGLINPDSAVRCDCGYDFTTKEIKGSYLYKTKEPLYAGFWSRLSANIVDSIIFIPIGFLGIWLVTKSNIIAVFINPVFQLLFVSYTVYFHGKFGATYGKKSTAIKVVKLDFSPISWRQAFLRSSVDIIFALLMAIGNTLTLLSISHNIFQDKNVFEASQEIQKNMPFIFFIFSVFYTIWFWGEVIVLLFNKKKRALHDFIAGTVVINQ
jgi:uncharacterized RDD family membrane protein YckC